MDTALTFLLNHDPSYNDVKIKRDALESKMTSDQEDEASRLEQVWREKHPAPLPIL